MFNQRIYTGDGQIHFSGQHLGNGRRIGRVSFNEEGLDSEKLAIRGIRTSDKMNRSIFEMKPIEMNFILEKPRNKEPYCYCHQKFERTKDFSNLIAYPALREVISKDKKQQLYDECIQSGTIEPFSSSFTKSADSAFSIVIKNQIRSILSVLNDFECFDIYRKYWKDLENNLQKNHWNINILGFDDQDVAYSINKGQILNFKSRDSSNYIPYKILTYVICHELSHVACKNEQGHTETFMMIMHVIEAAAFIAGLLRPNDYPDEVVKFSNQTIVSKNILIDEILDGFYLLRRSGKDIDYINSIIKYFESQI